ncbi:hypothetical protein MP638_005615 [Amoeboaphelidium occidentale]|nr:hypothetical protein MP638_005615 [Amoeboaphelidium occidentale]
MGASLSNPENYDQSLKQSDTNDGVQNFDEKTVGISDQTRPIRSVSRSDVQHRPLQQEKTDKENQREKLKAAAAPVRPAMKRASASPVKSAQTAATDKNIRATGSQRNYSRSPVIPQKFFTAQTSPVRPTWQNREDQYTPDVFSEADEEYDDIGAALKVTAQARVTPTVTATRGSVRKRGFRTAFDVLLPDQEQNREKSPSRPPVKVVAKASPRIPVSSFTTPQRQTAPNHLSQGSPSGPGTSASPEHVIPLASAIKTKDRRAKVYWTDEEFAALQAGMRKHGTKWSDIKKDPAFEAILENRTVVDLKDKARNEKRARLRNFGMSNHGLGVFAQVSAVGGEGAWHYESPERAGRT